MEGGKDSREIPGQTFLCTNPLTWKVDEEKASPELNRGALPLTGEYTIKFWGDDKAQGVTFGPLGAPIKNHTWAQCQDGLLYVAEQKDNAFSKWVKMTKNYHNLDYPLFYMDIRYNAMERVSAYLKKRDEMF
jgi:hypothetical protein